jgi:TrpR-related protein YerC/YecD
MESLFSNSKAIEILCKIFMQLKTAEEFKKVFHDILTPSEIKELANRVKIAEMLDMKIPYEVIVEKTGASSTTIARTQKWLQKGKGGFRIILERMKSVKKKTP